MNDCYIGIDPGQKGALTALNMEGQVVAWKVMPLVGKEVDTHELARWLYEFPRPVVILERQHAMPKQGLGSTFVIGHNYGLIQGTIQTMGVTHTIIPARQWQKSMLVKRKGMDTKDAALQAARALWPKEEWLPTARCRKPHDGAIDAALMAEYGRRQYWNFLG